MAVGKPLGKTARWPQPRCESPGMREIVALAADAVEFRIAKGESYATPFFPQNSGDERYARG